MSDERLCKYYRNVMAQFYNNFAKSDERILHDAFNLASLVADERRRRHVLFVMLGFYTGGGEIFSICLANALVERGFTVSVMVLETERPNAEIRSRLDARIAVYERPLIDEMGFVEFARESQVDIVHTHFVWADILIHRDIAKIGVPYVVTHHGSYEATDIEPDVLQSILAVVSHWVYIAEKNLTKLDVLGLDRAKVTKLPNALPKRKASFPHSRESLDIEANAFVFGVASRALRVKGWDIAIEAFKRVKAQSARAIYLLICGEGPDHAELSALYEETEGVRFLGYQRDIMGFYNICDCCVLPTRFPGESYPLTIIEAILVRRPVIATDIGEIKNMIEQNTVSAGLVVPYADEDEVFCASVAQAMTKMLDVENFNKFSANAAELGKTFDFDSLVSKYIEVYEKAGLTTVTQ